ncbi:signal recognition particle-docking protein FtsY [Candidatus Heimdallarchaeota archaeon B3_Heim]|nr:MAG: signal recognition particle-docking protein FtsY [Candidatus Heimdallarchaeota archaeon B3_Heim]
MSSLKKGVGSLKKKLSSYEISEKNVQRAIRDFKRLLITNDVSIDVADAIATDLAKKMMGKRARRFSDLSKLLLEFAEPTLIKIISPTRSIDLINEIVEKRKETEHSLTKDPIVILLLGINGTGKTTTIAKLAYLLKKKKMRVILAASDTFRSGAQEQLKIHADKVGVKIISGDYGSDSAAVAYDAIAHAKSKYADVVIIDTSGRMAINKDLMEEMKKIKRVSDPDYIILVVDALAGNDATKQAADFHKAITLDGVILSKMDADARGGALISVTHATSGVPILYIGTGQKYTNLERFDPEAFVRKILN